MPYLPEHLFAVGNYLDEPVRQAAESEPPVHSEGYDDAARLRRLRNRKRVKPVEDGNPVKPSLIGPLLMLSTQVN